jgi:hypothetical protein
MSGRGPVYVIRIMNQGHYAHVCEHGRRHFSRSCRQVVLLTASLQGGNSNFTARL